MIEITRVLCPIDFSKYSRRALDHAVAIARWYDATITALHVFAAAPATAAAPGIPMQPLSPLTPTSHEELLASLTRFTQEEVGSAVPIRFELCEGAAAAEIVTKASALSADLIVMGTHGRSGFERLMLGSVTEKVLRKASCPVLSVPPHAEGLLSPPPVLFKRILCATDFSDCSTHALKYAMSLAQEADARLTVLNVIELPPDVPSDVPETIHGGPWLREYAAAAEENRRERLMTVVPDSVRAYCRVETILATGTPYREILRIAAEQQSDLVVIGVHGRAAADLLFFGSTTQHVVRQATCPVLTLRTG